MVANALGSENVQDAALAIELFHTASLIADDLPSMDNDPIRRGKPTLHLAFNEKTAILATYALIAEGYRLIAKNCPPNLLPTMIQQVSKNTGLQGATAGQFCEDLKSDILTVHYLKTGALFELSFVTGWLLGGGDVKRVEEVCQAAVHFGLAFQIKDDIDDYDQDEGMDYNYARKYGIDVAKKRVGQELEEVKKRLVELDIFDLYSLAELLS